MDETGDYFTHAIYNNFSTFTPTRTISSNRVFIRDWVVQGWAVPSVSRTTPLAIQNTRENVYIEDGNLMLKQEGYPNEAVMAGRNVSVASITSKNGDIFHGSFRTEMKVEGATGGSVAAFFWYHDDKNEIDIEILAREYEDDEMPIHYTVHPAKDEDDIVLQNATAVIPLRGDNPGSNFQRHRFDWTKDELRFYQNSELVITMNERIPRVGGHVYLNLWADGGSWSGSPSTTDVLMTVRLIAIYHNTSASDAGMDVMFNSRCEKAGGPSERTVCLDTKVESGEIIPSSVAVVSIPLPIWTLSMLSFVLGIMLVI
ncbi:hypothetical protein VTO42DRAFT_3663 [Malbranchea cinnamomea]